MSSLIIVYLALVIVLPLALSGIVSYRTLPDGRACPLCGGGTLRLRARWLRWVSRVKPGAVLQRRWCLDCGWEGVCRRSAGEAPAAAEARETDGATPTGPESVASDDRSAEGDDGPGRGTPGAAGQAIDLRKLDVDGRRWRVLLETWCDTDTWYGRLLFGGPSGRLWADQTQIFEGPSPLDVLGQALSLSDRALAYRLRDVTSSH